MSKIENILNGFALFNAAIPGIAKIIVTLKDGREIDIGELVNLTNDIVEQKLKEAQDHLAKER